MTSDQTSTFSTYRHKSPLLPVALAIGLSLGHNLSDSSHPHDLHEYHRSPSFPSSLFNLWSSPVASVSFKQSRSVWQAEKLKKWDHFSCSIVSKLELNPIKISTSDMEIFGYPHYESIIPP